MYLNVCWARYYITFSLNPFVTTQSKLPHLQFKFCRVTLSFFSQYLSLFEILLFIHLPLTSAPILKIGCMRPGTSSALWSVASLIRRKSALYTVSLQWTLIGWVFNELNALDISYIIAYVLMAWVPLDAVSDMACR